jgi:hypothetical protein|tara:strand:- start:59 stop:766 length:708 start_codon:yes stop_codon:yes gene_type:complete
MALPKLNTQTFELNIPSTDEKIKYRPFLVKEEKILLQAQEGDNNEMLNSIIDIIKNCTFDKVSAETLPAFDIEYIFLKIRSKSVGEKVSLNVLAPDDNKTKIPVEVDLSKIEVEVEEDHNNSIDITDSIKVIMSYPTIKTFSTITQDIGNLKPQDTILMTAKCIHQIVDGVETYEARDLSEKEIVEFLENLTQEQFRKLQNFFITMPRLKKVINVTNPKTKKKGKVTLQGIQSFF